MRCCRQLDMIDTFFSWDYDRFKTNENNETVWFQFWARGGKFEHKCIKKIISKMISSFALKVSIMHLQWEFDDGSLEFLLTNLNVMLKVIEYIRKVFLPTCHRFSEWVIHKWSKIGGGCNLSFSSRPKFFK